MHGYYAQQAELFRKEPDQSYHERPAPRKRPILPVICLECKFKFGTTKMLPSCPKWA